MSKKIYKVLVTYKKSGDMFIEAESAQEAREIAEKVEENGKGKFDYDPYNDEVKAEDVQEVEADETEMAQAKEHAEALKEIIADAEALKEIIADEE